MKKSRKKIITVIILTAAAIAALWVTLGVVDFSRVHSYKLPIFSRWTLRYLDGGSGTYTGLGYSFEIKGDFIGTDSDPAAGVTSYTAKLFGVPVMSGVRCL